MKQPLSHEPALVIVVVLVADRVELVLDHRAVTPAPGRRGTANDQASCVAILVRTYEQTARVATAVNTLTLGAAFVLQAAVGWTLDLWPRTASGGWDPRGYSAALAGSLVLQVLVAARLMGGRR